ncbi:hypothetical protein BOTU111921_00095 [Bordetella tumbae]|uniref:hypothetical protein n=1 Tax=Bordetella tumbae TaxID=1649139 RepID=UPI0039EFC413
MRANALARSEQTSFPFTTTEAVHAAHRWFADAKPSMTLAAWRDHLLALHLAGVRATDPRECTARTNVWNQAFCTGVAQAISGAHHG